MKTALIFASGALGAWLLSGPQEETPQASQVFSHHGREIFFAVLEGLYDDGVTTEEAEILLRRGESGGSMHFIPGCPLCVPTVEAIRVYQRRPAFVSFKTQPDTLGPGLSPALKQRLRSEDLKTRLDVIQTLTARWIKRRVEARRLTPAERQEWQAAMAEGRKTGNEILSAMKQGGDPSPMAGADTCPTCEGANAAVK